MNRLVFLFSFLLFSLFLLSCTAESELKKKKGIHFLTKVFGKIADVDEDNWNVGLDREKEVSRGLKVKIAVPKVSDEAKKVLGKLRGINSWLFQVKRIDRGRSSIVGYYYFPWENFNRHNDSLILYFYYHAAAVSHRFRRFKCPAFNHRLKISDWDIDYGNAQERDFFVRENNSLSSRAFSTASSPLIVEGGTRMKSEYEINMALYDSNHKKIWSKYYPIDGKLEIKQEENVDVPSCAGIREELRPLPGNEAMDIKDLEIH